MQNKVWAGEKREQNIQYWEDRVWIQ
jgi:hypothetical protein